MEEWQVWVGIDWGRSHHDACVVDGQGKVLGERRFKHEGEALQKLCEWLRAHGEPGRVAVGLETPHGPVVETLQEQGFAVFSINPKQLDRFRDRFSLSRCKDDRLDARVLGRSLRTDQECFRRLQVGTATELELRECSRLCDELQQERQRWLNRLRDALWRYFPAMLTLKEPLDTAWSLELCALVPTPAAARSVPVAALEELFKKHRVRCIDAPTALQRLQVQPLAVTAAVVSAGQHHAALCIENLRLLNEQHRRELQRLEELTARLSQEQQKQEQRDVEILDSLPGVGRIVLATLIAEASGPLRDRDYHALRALSGAAPITRRSGKSCQTCMRHACNGRLRNAMYHCSRVAAQFDARCRQRYQTLRCRGKTHGHALRELADHLLLVGCALLRTGQLYDPEHSPNRS